MRGIVRGCALFVLAGLTVSVVMFRGEPQQQVNAAQPQELPADLAMVPADAVGFVHVRLADLWKNEVMDGFRKTWEKAGAKALEALDKQFVPAPSTISRGTAFVILDENKQPQPVGILTFSAAFDSMQVVKAYLPEHKTEKVGDKTIYRSPQIEIEFYFPDNKHIVIGFNGSLDHYLAKAPAKDGPLAPAIKLAAEGKKVAVASADISALPIPPEALEEIPENIRPILKAKQLTVAVDLGADARLDVRAAYADVAAAQEAEKAVKALADMGRMELAKLKKEVEDKLYDPEIKAPRPAEELPETIAMIFALGALNRLDETLADPKFITRDKTELALAVPLPKELLVLAGSTIALGAAALVPALGKLREAAGGIKSSNNLKQIGIAIHNYLSATGDLPTDIVDKNGKPLLSWRVRLLPYIEQDLLYKSFKLDEPWDSENNKKASQAVIKLFLSPDAVLPEKSEWGLTNYRGISGKGAAFEPGKRVDIALDFGDGTSNTIMVIETDELVPWAKPGDYPFDESKDLPRIVPVGKRDTFYVLFADGHVRALKTTTPEKALKAAFTRNGGEVVDLDK